jgi:hypothetical protein
MTGAVHTIRTVAILALLAMPLATADAQEALYMPRAVARVPKWHRARNGKPGASYWQNRAKYEITVTALPRSRSSRPGAGLPLTSAGVRPRRSFPIRPVARRRSE